MWKQNLFFLTLVAGGVSVLAVNLIPPREPLKLVTYRSEADAEDDLRKVVALVDASFREDWSEQKIAPAPVAPDLTIARWLALGLMGTIPSLEEIRQFELLPHDQRFPWWIDQILQDRRSADYLSERLVRAVVGVEDGPFILFRRRRFAHWLTDQLASNRPYDAVVRDIIASKGLWTDQPATNFISVTAQTDKANRPDPIRLGGRVTRAFLGIRLDCAQCHNHPFAKWKQSDFEGLAAFFGQTHVGFTGIYDGEGELEITDLKTQEKGEVAPRVPFATELLPDEGSRRERLAAWVTHRDNPNFARAGVNRVWALLFGRPLVDPVDNLDSDQLEPKAMAILAKDFATHGFDLQRLIRVIAATEVFRLDSAADRELTESDEKAWATFPLAARPAQQVAGSAIQASSVSTINLESHIFTRITRVTNQNDFLKRYGDGGEDEFTSRGGTIPQRLLLMNGELVRDLIKETPFNASKRVSWLAHDDAKAIESAYLIVLSRRPTPEENDHFLKSLADTSVSRAQRLEDLFWTLINSTEFSWNH